ncbi:NDP-hexose 2,3-dehydratase [Phytohabitans suffuscus]|uniref:NDP-hexose 2,3-dehydratase n=1 Tax=Phytohabitans suffuscus TaxID=624315 RepID=A0A6F8YR22_9ACTN|nr:NDP-hexose 2,3-dehydratase [Phytohabitans suffuscus]
METRPRPGTDLPDRLAASVAHAARPVEEIAAWLDERRQANPSTVERVPFADLAGWEFAPDSGDLVHSTGRFFGVHGLRVRTDYGHRPAWEQPIIDQRDVAILGIVAREIDGVLHFLMQAKMEPGNVNTVQLSPTVQATSSNYLRAHKGAPSRYVEYFVDRTRGRALVDVLQSEQGSWFVGKRNRNIVVEALGPVEPHDDFVWLTLGEILALLRQPHLVNMDARTVLSCLPVEPPAAGGEGASWWSGPQVRSWLTERKAAYALAADYLPLASVAGWRRTADEIAHDEGRYFKVVGVRVSATNREVAGWSQPLLEPASTGLAAFVMRRIGGVPHVLARADLRPGYRDVVEVGPTVQCTPDNYVGRPASEWPAYLDLVLSRRVRPIYDVMQSEEGGRFHHALTRHLVVEVGGGFPLGTGPDFAWLTLGQLGELTRHSYQLDMEARSLLLCLRGLTAASTPTVRTGGSR